MIDEMTPNKGQSAGADEFFKFLLDPKQKEIAISGPAGTGKTFLLQWLKEKTLPRYREMCQIMGIPITIRELAMTATTNRAADVLSGSMAMRAQTIHSFMNLKIYDNYSTGKQELKRTDRFCVHSNYLIFVDEASMVDRKLYKTIHEATHSSCKIVWVGDQSQLPPVGEKVSSVFRPEIPRIVLTELMRNAGQPALQALCQQLRDTVKTGVFKPIHTVPGVVDQLTNEEFQHHVDTVFSQEGADTRLLVYTNNLVHAYNGYIRNLRGYDEKFHNGERVVNNSSVQLTSKKNLPAEREYTLKVAPDVEIRDLNIAGTTIPVYDVELIEEGTQAIIPCVLPVDRNKVNQLLKVLKKNKEWSDFFRVKNQFPDLRPRDCSTVHKSQGSTFETVYIDLDNIGRVTDKNIAARMLYVAVSRARSHVFFYGSLPPRFSGD